MGILFALIGFGYLTDLNKTINIAIAGSIPVCFLPKFLIFLIINKNLALYS